VVAVNGSRKAIALQVVPIRLPSLKDVHFLVLFEEERVTGLEGARKRPRKGEGLPKEREDYLAQLETILPRRRSTFRP